MFTHTRQPLVNVVFSLTLNEMIVLFSETGQRKKTSVRPDIVMNNQVCVCSCVSGCSLTCSLTVDKTVH